jgi:integrase
MPLAGPLVKFVSTMPAADKSDAPLFPRAFQTFQSQQRSGTLSNQFYSILVAAGLAKKKSHKAQADGQGRAAKREQSKISFHSLRHTVTSILKAAGIGESVAMAFVGHDTASVSHKYTHIPIEALRKAARKIPDLTQP